MLVDIAVNIHYLVLFSHSYNILIVSKLISVDTDLKSTQTQVLRDVISYGQIIFRDYRFFSACVILYRYTQERKWLERIEISYKAHMLKKDCYE